MTAFCADDRSAPLLSDTALLPSQFHNNCLCLSKEENDGWQSDSLRCGWATEIVLISRPPPPIFPFSLLWILKMNYGIAVWTTHTDNAIGTWKNIFYGTFVKIVRKEIIATGGRGYRMTIRGYIGNKFDCLCQISSVYASHTASFSLTTVIYVILLQLACWPPSCAQGRSRSGTHTVPRFCWALGDEFAVVQLYWHKTLEMMYQY